MKLILEGPDGVGKTTLANKLARHYGCDLLHLIGEGSKRHEDYVAKANLNNVISDRSFLSEVAYSLAHERPSQVSAFEAETLLRQYRARGWQILILNAKPEFLRTRLSVRGDEDENNIRNIEKISLMYKALSFFYDIPMIDVEKASLGEVLTMLEANAGDQNNRK